MRFIADVVASGGRCIGARQQVVVVLSIVLGQVLRLSLIRLTLLLLFVEEGDVLAVKIGSHAHQHHIVDADEGHEDGNSGVDGIGGIEEEQSDKDHEDASPVVVSQEFEVLKHVEVLQFCNGEESCEGYKVDGQNVEEGVGGARIFGENGETDDCTGGETGNDEGVEGLCNVDEAGSVNLFVIIMGHRIIIIMIKEKKEL